MNSLQAAFYFEEIIGVYSNERLTIKEKYTQLLIILGSVAVEITKEEKLQFSNLFSRISFICTKHGVNRRIHSFRIAANKITHSGLMPSEQADKTYFKFLVEFIASSYEADIPEALSVFFPEQEFIEEYSGFKTASKIKHLRVEVAEIKDDFLICDFDGNEHDPYIKVSINDEGINDSFDSVDRFWVGAQLNLLNIEIDEQAIYHAKFLILEPDYLLDVSAIAECFQDYGVSEFQYLKSKFDAVPNNKYIRLGNFANLVVDELFANKNRNQISFKKTFEKDFKAYPFEYTVCEDLNERADFIKYWQDAEMHFERIKRVITRELSSTGVDIDKAVLEPSFLCDVFGIQGRLDILELKEDGKSKIIELKSGGVPFPDDGKSIKPNHRSQLYLYYQLVGIMNDLDFSQISESTEGFILYSKVDRNNMRFDKPNLKRIQEIFNCRNKIIANEFTLAKGSLEEVKEIIESISKENLIKKPKLNAKFRSILEQQFDRFQVPINNLSALEQAYFYSYISFVAKEQSISKLGSGGYLSNNGFANLWLSSFEEKKERHEVLYDLEIFDNQVNEEKKEIIFLRTNLSNSFVNFRDGDMTVLYPKVEASDSATSNQVFKCSIKHISKENVVVSFRYKQSNTAFFEKHKTWALERDSLDSGFTSMYRGLYAFLKSSQSKKDLLLTQRKPIKSISVDYNNKNLSDEKNRVIQKALSAKDYFLLNGPPGTGKTSIFIKELLKELYKDKEVNVLLLAYTNRAVDELCSAVNGSKSNKKYNRNFIRIGNPISCSKDYKVNLLSSIIESETERIEKTGGKFSRELLSEIIGEQNVFVSTMSSISGKTDVFKLKKFDVVIIDEASQILEPQMLSVLSYADKFILVGDHKQLPAIVLQDSVHSKVESDVLKEIGLSNRNNSLFERLFTFCESNNLDHAFDMLTYQGRMHQEIAKFPNTNFYNSDLKQAYDIPNLEGAGKLKLSRQVNGLDFTLMPSNDIGKQLINNRLMFFNCSTDTSISIKSSMLEADLVVEIVKEYQYLKSKKSIGIITPFRNQIALIKQKLEEHKIPNFESITVDTVERYQGSQRDIIILSFAINSPFQLDSVINLNNDGSVDRKLNVALTRAREQMILVGNQTILSLNPLYKKLIDYVIDESKED
jgi:DNA replication ATP-dependent helicase Dna2